MPRKSDWSKADGMWGEKTDAEIADVVGVAVQTVSAYRSRNLLPRWTGKHRLEYPDRFMRGDWSKAEGLWGWKTDQEIADVVGVSWEHVRAFRAQYSIPKNQIFRRRTTFDWSGVDWNASAEEIAAKVGCQVTTARHYKYAPHRRRGARERAAV